MGFDERRTLGPLLFGGRSVAAEEFGDGIDDSTGEGDGCGEEQSIEAEDVFVARGPESKGDEEGGADAEGDSSRRAAGDAEGAMEVGLAEAQDHERYELQY